MTSGRHRSDVATLFDVFCELGAPKPGEKLAPVLQHFPANFDSSILRSVQKFAFPCQLREVEIDAVQLFSFVLTDSNSKFSYGFCRYTPRTDTCICFLSGYNWPSVFFEALNGVSELLTEAHYSTVTRVLTKFYGMDLPPPGSSLRFSVKDHLDDDKFLIDFCRKTPDRSRMPSLADDVYLQDFYNAIDPRQMLVIFASLLKERRILFTGRKVSNVSSCVHAAAMLLYPMVWQSAFVPILPESRFDIIKTPEPYLLGVPKTTFDKAKQNSRDIGEVVIVDIDNKVVSTPFDDVSGMPSEVAHFLKNQLRSQLAMDDSFAKNFLRAMVLMFGEYSSGFVGDSPDFTWSKERFIAKKSLSYQPYLGSLLEADGVQYLKQFIHDRLQLLKDGHVPGDQFETEIKFMDPNNKKSPRREHRNPHELLDENDDMIESALEEISKANSAVFSALKMIQSSRRATETNLCIINRKRMENKEISNTLRKEIVRCSSPTSIISATPESVTAPKETAVNLNARLKNDRDETGPTTTPSDIAPTQPEKAPFIFQRASDRLPPLPDLCCLTISQLQSAFTWLATRLNRLGTVDLWPELRSHLSVDFECHHIAQDVRRNVLKLLPFLNWPRDDKKFLYDWHMANNTAHFWIHMDFESNDIKLDVWSKWIKQKKLAENGSPRAQGGSKRRSAEPAATEAKKHKSADPMRFSLFNANTAFSKRTEKDIVKLLNTLGFQHPSIYMLKTDEVYQSRFKKEYPALFFDRFVLEDPHCSETLTKWCQSAEGIRMTKEHNQKMFGDDREKWEFVVPEHENARITIIHFSRTCSLISNPHSHFHYLDTDSVFRNVPEQIFLSTLHKFTRQGRDTIVAHARRLGVDYSPWKELKL